jgi:multidrug efflux pump subunit AcrA (membrane-fusion protein)
VSFVWPTVDEEPQRSSRVFPNQAVRPGCRTLRFEAVVDRDAVNVPAEAVVQTGERNLVFVVGERGALEPREVVLGARAGDRFQIDSGLAPGERIVASANFLVDAESRLVTGGGMANMPGMNTEKRP